MNKSYTQRNQNKTYEMIREAMGKNDGPTYANFSNIFSLGGQGNQALGVFGMYNTNKKPQTVRAKGTTVTDPNKQQKDLVLTQFKSKILQKLQDNLKNRNDKIFISDSTKPADRTWNELGNSFDFKSLKQKK